MAQYNISMYSATNNRRTKFLFTGFGIVMFFLFILGLSHGSVRIPSREVFIILTGGEGNNPVWTDIVLNLRLPRILAAMLGGSALGIGGLLMQTLFLNPLAGPFVLGINAGASLGVALVILLSGIAGFSSFLSGIGMLAEMGMVIAATLGSALVIIMVLILARRIASKTVLLLIGIMFGYAVSALVSVLIHFSMAERVQSFLAWTFGSFSTVSWKELKVMIPVITISLALTFPLGKDLNVLLMGETYASSMGVAARKVKNSVILLTALLAATVTAFCGPVAFLGIAVPHLARNIARTGDHRVLIPMCILLGSIVALLSDLIAHFPGQGVVLPLNAVTSLIGAPVVIWVITRYQHVGRS